jgi:hypothetical protein
VPKFTSNSVGRSYVLNALNGGAGHEWITLLNRERKSIRVARFGATLQFSARGLVAEEPPYLLSSYRGNVHDRVAPSVAGAVVLKNQQVELAVIMRGPFTNYDGTDYVVFGINRGAGSTLEPVLPSEPWLMADALVTVAVGPDGSTYSGTILDRTTGALQSIDPRAIRVQVPVVRVLLNAGQLPSEGLPSTRFRFAVWTETQLNPTIGELASLVPQNQMIPIGLAAGERPTL